MAVASLTASDVERGVYLKDKRRLFRVTDAVRDAVLLEDCKTYELQWWPVRDVLRELRRVTPQRADDGRTPAA